MAEAECQAKRGRCRPGDSVNSKNKGLEEEEETEKIRLLAAFSLHRAPARTESPSLNAKLGSLVWCLGRNKPQIKMAEVITTYQGKSVKDVPAEAFIKAFSAYLKSTGKVQLPAYVDFAKTASFKELAPLDSDWYYVRTAAIARRVYLRQGLGVGAMRRMFGGSTNKKGSVTPEHHAKASGGVIRHALHTLESLGLVEVQTTGKGRRITSEGQRQMDLVAARVEVPKFHYVEAV